MYNFRHRIFLFRKAKSLSLAELGELSGIPLPRLHDIETLKYPLRPIEAEHLSRHLGCAPNDLMEEAESK